MPSGQSSHFILFVIMLTGNQLANYRERTEKLLPMMNRKFCVKCGHSKDTFGGTSVLLSPLSNRRGFVCRECK